MKELCTDAAANQNVCIETFFQIVYTVCIPGQRALARDSLIKVIINTTAHRRPSILVTFFLLSSDAKKLYLLCDILPSQRP